MKYKLRLLLGLNILGLSACQTAPQQGGDVEPKLNYQQNPEYPLALRKTGTTGMAIVEFVVSADGDVVEAHVVSASHPSFGQAAVAAVYKWKFKPGTRNGRRVNARLQVPVYFSLEDVTPAGAKPATQD